ALPLLGAAERHQLLAEWNDTAVEPSAELALDLFAVRAESVPDRVAIEAADLSAAALSYGELDRRATALARGIDAASAERGIAGLWPRPRGPRSPLSHAQERLWFLDRLEPGSATYNIAAHVGLTGQLDLSAFRRALGEIVRRHEALRTRFVLVDGQP